MRLHLTLPLSLTLLAPAIASAAVDFVRDIQPIFQERCYQCHGPHKQEAALRFDHKASAMKGSDNGPVILPNKGAESKLVHALRGTNPKLKMPRKGGPLPADQITLIEAWIDEGAPWPDSASVVLTQKTDHWAFIPPVKPPVPAIAALPLHDAAWKASPNPIDAFIAARLIDEGLQPSPPAAVATLARRMHLDLTGLPPTPADSQRFASATGNRVEALARDLLASPHYGERWGRLWLDAARYADSNGYEKDPMRFIWFYRDWVIKAFNDDLPYDQFITQQLAGDELPNATQDQIVATGFLRNSMINEEGGVDPEQFRMESMFDRMDTIGKSILGLTVGCCQCHNHKYDPISQEEYYRMFAYLNNDNEPSRVVYTTAQQQQIADIHRQIRRIDDELKSTALGWEQDFAKWKEGIRSAVGEWHPLQAPFIDDTTGGQKMLLQKDGSFLAQSYAPTRSSPKFEVAVDGGDIGAFKLELMNDSNLPAYGPGRSQRGTCALTEFIVEAEVDGKSQPVKFTAAFADFGEPENSMLAGFAKDKDPDKDQRVTGPIGYAIDGDDKTAWGIDAGPGRRNTAHTAIFIPERPLSKATKLSISLSMKHGGWNSDDLQTMNLGRFRISYSRSAPKDPTMAVLNADWATFRSRQVAWTSQVQQINALWQQHPEGTTSLILEPRQTPRMTAVLKRGDFLKPGDPVKAGVPAVLNDLPKNADGSRLTFARWITDRKSPTTARAFVNRVWQAYFGTGLIDTPEDLGTQGSPPSHPQLLDWLACDFMDHGWSVKHLHELIVTSLTYQQSSQITPALLERDPYNRLLARGPRFRVEGEVIRDIQLSVSGLLNPSVGGRPVMPPAPAYLFEKPASYAPFPWAVETDNNQFRRAVYTFRRRSTPYPFLSTFDVPNGETACVRRTKSNTPMQALMTLNETMSIEAAKALAQRMNKEGGKSPQQQIDFGFRLCTGREPTPKEMGALIALMERQAALKESLDAATIVARVLLNLDETLTKE